MYLIDFIKQEQDNGNYIGMMLLDLQKAFDTVNHKIMLQKLEAIGLHESAIAWSKSYLYGRQQSVEIGEAISNPMTVTCGVPQGSILGPLLFLIYILMIFTQLFAPNYFYMLMIQLFYLCLFARSEHRPSTKERHCFLSVAIFSISFQVYPISFVSFSVSLCQVFRGLPLLLFPGGFHVMA